MHIYLFLSIFCQKILIIVLFVPGALLRLCLWRHSNPVKTCTPVQSAQHRKCRGEIVTYRPTRYISCNCLQIIRHMLSSIVAIFVLYSSNDKQDLTRMSNTTLQILLHKYIRNMKIITSKKLQIWIHLSACTLASATYISVCTSSLPIGLLYVCACV